MHLKWHNRFMEMANLVATWSKDPSSKVGAVYVDPTSRRILSTGYNGFPVGIQDDERLNDRETKLGLVVHGEMNGIYNATHNGVSLRGSYLYVAGLPLCPECAKGVIQVGVKRVYIETDSVENERWGPVFEKTKRMLNEAGIEWQMLVS